MSRFAIRLCTALTVGGLCLAGRAFAQEMPASYYHAVSHKKSGATAVDYSKYYESEFNTEEPESPSDAAPPVARSNEPCDCDACCDSCCDSCCEEEEEPNPCGDPWTLQGWAAPCSTEGPWKFGGWINGGITGNSHNERGQNANLPVAFNTQSNGAMGNQAWGWAERTSDTGGCGWDWGFRVDYLFGSDARFTQASGDIGWDTEWDSGGIYGSAMPQLYGVLSYNNVNVKIGHFFTIIGYEVVPATGNFFYSHAYTMVWGEPFTHTGVLADYKFTDQTTIYAGWTQGWDTGFNNANNANTFLGGVSWKSCDERNTLAWMVNAGDWGDGNVFNQGNIYMQSIVFQHQFDRGWKYIFQSDLGVNTNLPTDSTCWYGVNQYLFREINCCWAIGARFEWFRDQDGVRVPDADGNGNAGDYWEVTLGLNWKPHANINVRPEVRYDWHTGGGTPYANATADEQVTYGVDAWFTF